jgi:hypothetical protein
MYRFVERSKKILIYPILSAFAFLGAGQAFGASEKNDRLFTRPRTPQVRLEVNFYGRRQQILSDATTIQIDFFTGYGMKNQRKQSVTMRLREAKDRIVVANSK